MLIDTHCHLTDEKFQNIQTEVEKAFSLGVKEIFVPSTSIEDAKRAICIADENRLFTMIGVHPEEMSSVNSTSEMVKELHDLAINNKRVIGVGEIGLDFYWDREKKTKEKQLEIFLAQMELAVNLKLPVVIHMREAEEEMRSVLEKLKEQPRGQFHCFAGSEEFLRYVVGKGYYVSFAGNITYKNAQHLRELIHKVPSDRLLLETDAPYLSPEPLRGTVNTPRNVKIIASAIAHELLIDAEKLIEQTGKNALCLYSLDI